jgi:hypothetical protein
MAWDLEHAERRSHDLDAVALGNALCNTSDRRILRSNHSAVMLRSERRYSPCVIGVVMCDE